MVGHRSRRDAQAEEVVEADQLLHDAQTIAAVLAGEEGTGRVAAGADLKHADELRLEVVVVSRSAPAGGRAGGGPRGNPRCRKTEAPRRGAEKPPPAPRGGALCHFVARLRGDGHPPACLVMST